MMVTRMVTRGPPGTPTVRFRGMARTRSTLAGWRGEEANTSTVTRRSGTSDLDEALTLGG